MLNLKSSASKTLETLKPKRTAQLFHLFRPAITNHFSSNTELFTFYYLILTCFYVCTFTNNVDSWRAHLNLLAKYIDSQLLTSHSTYHFSLPILFVVGPPREKYPRNTKQVQLCVPTNAWRFKSAIMVALTGGTATNPAGSEVLL